MASIEDINTLIQRGNYSDALRAAQSEARRRQKDPLVVDALARAFVAAGRHKNALATYDRLIKLAPRHPKPLADKAHLQQQMGLMQDSNRNLRRALRLEPANGSLLRMLAVTERLNKDDPAIATAISLWDSGKLKPADRMHAGYALFSVLGKAGFPYLKEANDIQARAQPWSISTHEGQYDALIRATQSRPWPKPSGTAPAQRPIFVSGLPRSGTTLVEQILSCHPKVTPYGETTLPIKAANSVIYGQKGYHAFSTLSGDAFAMVGQRYLQGIAHFHGDAQIFTDKSVQSLVVAGLLKEVMPNSRMIFVRRDPRDVGWSIYRNFFAGQAHGFSTSMADIGAYAKLTYRMIAHWAETYPDAFLQVSYEDLVRKPEPEIRAILDYCGLDWNPACLAPEENKRHIKTLSVEQARSPISPKSIGGWRRYRDELAPMLAAMGDWVTQWD